ncbi:anchored repeat ABC transporter, substrate-binding protein [Arcanobacterium ihumii]|uniref:anchored repeat ABC transporter, substrate-binding protein n=1 Tax=Arcanobacterium ihumii TaxID=2138162 RepID=UPI001F451DE2|nr:anchored repeat ABC transporter, substrate-binding protein [Arcanobacterium ihumii]
MTFKKYFSWLASFGMVAAASACSAATVSPNVADHERMTIVASTPIIADLVRHVAPEAKVVSLVPVGADPHTYEPSLATLRDVSHAKIAFSNQLLLEESSLIETIDANLPDGTSHVALGQEAVPYGARHIRLVEDASLSTIWLGFRVDGQGSSTDQVRISATSVNGPGHLSAFTTGTFGNPTPWIASYDGIDGDDVVSLPTNAHTHMSWGFSKPGKYDLNLKAELIHDGVPKLLGTTALTFMVGKDPQGVAPKVLDSGHVDITAHLKGEITLEGTGETGSAASYDPRSVVISVPHSVATTVPSNEWKFLGAPGSDSWVLAQAVLGKHVHGEIDPHLWHDVKNAIAYVEVIRDRLSALDPEHATNYRDSATSYLEELRNLDDWMRSVLGSIPASQRKLVTAHDSFGYLAKAYGFDIAGFIAPNPSLEPSVQTLANLTRTLRDTQARAVFIEPTNRTHAAELINLAHSAQVRLCEVQSDTFAEGVNSYVELMEFNTKSLKSCLDPDSLPAWDRTWHSKKVEQK